MKFLSLFYLEKEKILSLQKVLSRPGMLLHALGRQRQTDHECEASLVYRVSQGSQGETEKPCL